MIYCAKCGLANREGSRFCNGCGEHLEDFSNCPHCRFPNPSGGRFCNQCGGRLKLEDSPAGVSRAAGVVAREPAGEFEVPSLSALLAAAPANALAPESSRTPEPAAPEVAAPPKAFPPKAVDLPAVTIDATSPVREAEIAPETTQGLEEHPPDWVAVAPPSEAGSELAPDPSRVDGDALVWEAPAIQGDQSSDQCQPAGVPALAAMGQPELPERRLWWEQAPPEPAASAAAGKAVHEEAPVGTQASDLEAFPRWLEEGTSQSVPDEESLPAATPSSLASLVARAPVRETQPEVAIAHVRSGRLSLVGAGGAAVAGSVDLAAAAVFGQVVASPWPLSPKGIAGRRAHGRRVRRRWLVALVVLLCLAGLGLAVAALAVPGGALSLDGLPFLGSPRPPAD